MLYLIGICVVILKVLVGLGFVIFVHELGHFAVAKACGVKCEKFYLGFDIGGLRFCKFRWGETEYGIGILPLGGYVKMLGQEDNPSRLKEEIDRAKQGGMNGEAAAAQQALYDPRSFLAQSVPKRMAIISAGVIMNVIFAFVMAVVAFSMGVEQTPCVIGSVFPGEPAWQADVRVGDKILKIAGKDMVQFRDLQTAITLGDVPPEGVPLLVERPGVKEPLTIMVKPDRSRGGFLIGVASGKDPEVIVNRKTWMVQKRHAALPGSTAATAEPPFLNGDKIVQIDDVPIENYAQIDAQLARKPERTINVTVERTEKEGKAEKTERLTIPVAPNPMRTLGMVMKMGEISSIQVGSPAAAADIQPGDMIRKVNGNAVADPMTLPQQLDAAAGQNVELTIQREASKTPLVVPVRAREPLGFLASEIISSPVGVPSLGLAYRVLNRVDRVIEGSPAAEAGLLPEDLVVRAKLIPPSKEVLSELQVEQPEISIKFTEAERNWPSFISALQNVLPGTTVELTVSRQEKETAVEKTVTLTPVKAADWFNPDRGLAFEQMTFNHKVESIGDALKLGGKETLDSLTIVFSTVRALGTNQVSARNLGGPVLIFKMAMAKADQGTAHLLLFLTMLSANLAVLNFLPIPLLDGGLMMFLLYEGIRRKPANEHVQVVLTYIGLAFILGLMAWVLGLDFGWIARR